ncbi:MAG: hypothetical protein IKC03_02410 [Oscillospiraceae bacterium]|nr:hypothetical protein [Oscillospiraceae bacterium]
MKKQKLRMAVCVALVCSVLAAFAALAVEAGSQNDPLVTLSYLNETYLGQILARVDEKLAGRNDTLRAEWELELEQRERELLLEVGGSVNGTSGGSAISFVSVKLAPGQMLRGGVGCEVLLRTGSASCVSEGKSTPGLVDTTDGTSINDGTQMVENHLYLMTTERGVKADSEVVLMVRGNYVIQ